MTRPRRAILALPLVLAPVASVAGVCVKNGSDTAHLFAAEVTGGSRLVAQLVPGEVLCSGPGASADGVVSVFEHADALEGCSRLVKDAVTETLVKYADFDRCRWSSHE